MDKDSERKLYANNSLIIVLAALSIFSYMRFIENIDIGWVNITLALISGLITGIAIILRFFNGNKPYVIVLYAFSIVTIYTIYQANALHATNGIILAMSCAAIGWYLPQFLMRKNILRKLQK